MDATAYHAAVTDLFSYTGKHVVLTGGSSGVGEAAVGVLAEQGCEEITVLDVNEPSAQTVRYIATDMSDPASIDASVDSIEGPVDVLFNNAGVAGVHPTDFVVRVNYLGVRRLTEGLLPLMPRGAAIVNTASIAGLGWPSNLTEISQLMAIDDWDDALAWVADHAQFDEKPYEFSKELAQVWTMHSSHRTYVECGVRTNSVCPGVIDTPLLGDFKQHLSEQTIDWTIDQMSGVLTAREVANVLVMLGSDASVAMNGHNLIADHGFSAYLQTGQLDFTGLG